MKILVAIANYGMKNIEYAKKLIQEYRSMPFNIKIFVYSEAPKIYGDDVTVTVGLPSKDPWSLPFAHKKLFVDNAENYDLFIYTEDDILIKENNIRAFIRVTSILPENEIGGFMRYEVEQSNRRNYLDVNGTFHWDPKSVKNIGEYTFAYFSNDHSACYLLTKLQLQKAISSGGYLVPPYEGKYAPLETAATDPYTQCGFKKVICISHLHDFEVHHLPNAYIGKLGISEVEFNSQIKALNEVVRGERPSTEMLEEMKESRPTMKDKNYYELCHKTALSLVPQNTKSVLSIGCGSAETESRIVEKGIECVCIPLDNVIGVVAEMKGVKTLYPKFENSLSSIADKRFDCILLLNILQFVDDPLDLLMRCNYVLRSKGILIGTIPNPDCVDEFLPNHYKGSTGSNRVRSYGFRQIIQTGGRIIGHRVKRTMNRGSICDISNGSSNGRRWILTTRKEIRLWFMRVGIEIIKMDYETEYLTEKRRRLAFGPFKSLFAENLIFMGRKKIN